MRERALRKGKVHNCIRQNQYARNQMNQQLSQRYCNVNSGGIQAEMTTELNSETPCSKLS